MFNVVVLKRISVLSKHDRRRLEIMRRDNQVVARNSGVLEIYNYFVCCMKVKNGAHDDRGREDSYHTSVLSGKVNASNYSSTIIVTGPLPWPHC